MMDESAMKHWLPWARCNLQRNPFGELSRCERAELAVVFGSNPAVSQASFVHLSGGSQTFQRLIDRGGHVVWIDPRKSESAKRWGEHVPIVPGDADCWWADA